MSKLGDKIKEIRINEGLSQEAFAKELGYTSKSTINKIEKGINEISYDKLMLLIDKYNLTLDQMVKIILTRFHYLRLQILIYIFPLVQDHMVILKK